MYRLIKNGSRMGFVGRLTGLSVITHTFGFFPKHKK
jgi:hypothetical protein